MMAPKSRSATWSSERSTHLATHRKAPRFVTDLSRAKEPWMVLTGDTLFVGDIGRSDFGGENAADALFTSLHGKLLALPDYVEVYPGHISGSPCGRSMSGKPSSTIGFERRHNMALTENERDRFVEAMTEFVSPKPSGF
jgi:glyoxylase-like metal-dependent hydrolase (beta-lactamase superfamily II)